MNFRNRFLFVLNSLLRNGLTDDAAKALAEMLSVNTTLRYLYIEENEGIKTDGCVALAQVLRKNSTLMALSLRRCQCSRDSVYEIVKGG